MKIQPYWTKGTYEGTDAKGRAHEFQAYGWSFTSAAEARQDAEARARRVFEWWNTCDPRELGPYPYPERPLREEIIERIGDPAAPHALITRNSYGALFLNTADALFVDVDFPPVRSRGVLEGLCALFSASAREKRRQAVVDETVAGVERWAELHRARSFRLYRTHAGLRLLFTDKLYDPKSDETLATLQELKADPLYVQLTRKQECFRARLTAKPWRCACPRPPAGYPWADAEAEKTFRLWARDYTKLAAQYRACELLREWGRAADLPVLRAVIAAHDHGANVASAVPLA